MKVRELIERLEEMNPEAEVFAPTESLGGLSEADDVQERLDDSEGGSFVVICTGPNL